MIPLLLYFSLLVIWVLLLWPALRLRGRVRLWVAIAAAAGLLVALYEIWMIFVWMPSVTAPMGEGGLDPKPSATLTTRPGTVSVPK